MKNNSIEYEKTFYDNYYYKDFIISYDENENKLLVYFSKNIHQYNIIKFCYDKKIKNIDTTLFKNAVFYYKDLELPSGWQGAIEYFHIVLLGDDNNSSIVEQ